MKKLIMLGLLAGIAVTAGGCCWPWGCGGGGRGGWGRGGGWGWRRGR